MDKLKQNAFWIGVGGIGLVLLVLIFFLVWQPLGGIQTANDKVVELRKKVEKETGRKPYIATQDYGKWLKRRQELDQQALDAAAAEYDERGHPFDAYFEGLQVDPQTPPEPDAFAARYKDEVDKLVNPYREKHKIAPNPDKPEENVPKVDVLAATDINADKVPATMKEFWMIQAVFEAANKLDLGGLKEISFAGHRGAADREAPPPYNRWAGVKVTIELPYSKLENFITELHSSQRVPFVLDDLEYRKIPESLSQFVSLKRPKKVKGPADIEKARYEDEIPEPPVHCEITLSAFDWTGLPAEVAVVEDEGEGAAKKTAKTKAGGGTRKKPPKEDN